MLIDGFQVEVKMSPLPSNCLECPFYQVMYDNWSGEEDPFDCVLHPIEDNFGIGVHRYAGCPLKETGKEN